MEKSLSLILVLGLICMTPPTLCLRWCRCAGRLIFYVCVRVSMQMLPVYACVGLWVHFKLQLGHGVQKNLLLCVATYTQYSVWCMFVLRWMYRPPPGLCLCSDGRPHLHGLSNLEYVQISSKPTFVLKCVGRYPSGLRQYCNARAALLRV